METKKIDGKIWIRFEATEFANLIYAYFQGSGLDWNESVSQFVKELNSTGVFIQNLASLWA